MPSSAWNRCPTSPACARAMHVKARLQWLLSGHAPWLDALIDEAEALARAAQHFPVQARLTVLRAAIAYAHRGDMVLGESLYRGALAMWERLRNQHAVNGGRYFVALMLHEAGRHEEAIAGADEVVQSARRLDDIRRVSQALQVRGKAQAALRRWRDAAASLRESIRLAWGAMAPVELTRAMRDLPPVLAHLHEGEAAVRLQAYSAAAARTHVGRADQYDMRQEKRVRRLVRKQMAPARWQALHREGTGLGPADAVALALHEAPGSADSAPPAGAARRQP